MGPFFPQNCHVISYCWVRTQSHISIFYVSVPSAHCSTCACLCIGISDAGASPHTSGHRCLGNHEKNSILQFICAVLNPHLGCCDSKDLYRPATARFSQMFTHWFISAKGAWKKEMGQSPSMKHWESAKQRTGYQGSFSALISPCSLISNWWFMIFTALDLSHSNDS